MWVSKRNIQVTGLDVEVGERSTTHWSHPFAAISGQICVLVSKSNLQVTEFDVHVRKIRTTYRLHQFAAITG